MDYNEFERLYRDAPVMFHLSMELFEDQGRKALSASTDQALCAAVREKLSRLFTEEKVRDIVKAAKDFAGLSAVERLSYAARCGIKLESDPVDEPGVCPLCGGSLIYGEDASAHRPHAVGWTCEKCGATGKEAYREVFDCHYDLRDAEGHPVDRQNQNQ